MSTLGDLETKYFYDLTPEVIDQALLVKGLRPSGRVFALNSLENRVYEVEVFQNSLLAVPFSTESVVVKFYRPGRWSKAAIQEEHSFLHELRELEIPVIAPLMIDGLSLFECPTTGFLYAIFPKMRGRLKDELNKEEIEQIGRLLGRIHNAGAAGSFSERPIFNPQNYIEAHFETLQKADFLPQTTVEHYLMVARQLSAMITPSFQHFHNQRIHGDLHRGNILWTMDGPWVVDFDDCVTGPKEQDLWLLLPGRDEHSQEDQELFWKAYHSMAREEVMLSRFSIEALRSIRMIHFNGWIARRFKDPTFQKTYSAFDTQNYWETQLLDIKEQLGQLQDVAYEY